MPRAAAAIPARGGPRQRQGGVDAACAVHETPPRTPRLLTPTLPETITSRNISLNSNHRYAPLDQAIAVLDIGKTRSKLWPLVAGRESAVATLDYVNAAGAGRPRQLDLQGIGAWLKRALAEAARLAEIVAIVPVGHGAAGVLMDRATRRWRARL